MDKKQLDAFNTFLKGTETSSKAQQFRPSEAGEVEISTALLELLMDADRPVAVSALYKESKMSFLELARLLADMEQFGLVQKARLDAEEELVSLTPKGEKLARSATGTA